MQHGHSKVAASSLVAFAVHISTPEKNRSIDAHAHTHTHSSECKCVTGSEPVRMLPVV